MKDLIYFVIITLLMAICIFYSHDLHRTHQELYKLRKKEAMFNYGIELQKYRKNTGCQDAVFDRAWLRRKK